MFATLKQIFNPRNKDLRKRILFTFVALFIFKIGTAIVVPGIDKDMIVGDLGFLELVNAMGGGAMTQFSIFSLGVMPYISASIITQILQMDFFPYFSDLAKEGQAGRNKINKLTRILGIILAFIQGYMFSFSVLNSNDPLDYLEISLILTAGTAFLVWLGDQITQKGIGNGLSLIIMAGIIATLPTMFVDAWNGLVSFEGSTQAIAFGIAKFAGFVLLYLAIIIAIIYEQTAERRIPIQYTNKTTSMYGKQQSYLPFQLNSAGVIPVIVASALLTIPSVIAQFNKNDTFTVFVSEWLSMTSLTGFILYVILIVLFAYFYTFIQIKPQEMAENLNRSGGFIPGIRPGEETVNYVKTTLKRITLVGSLALAVIAGLPILFGMVSSLPTSVSIGGTGILIVIGVALETYKQLESQLLSRSYRGRR